MPTSWRYVADLVERMVWTFLEAYAAVWFALTDRSWETLFTVANLKTATMAALAVLASSLFRKPIGNPSTASVLPAKAQPLPQQPEPPTTLPQPRPPTTLPQPQAAGGEARRQLDELLERVQNVPPIASPPPPPPPPPPLPPLPPSGVTPVPPPGPFTAPDDPPAPPLQPPPVRAPLGLLDPNRVGGRGGPESEKGARR